MPAFDMLTVTTGSGSAQAPVAERPIALPPDKEGAMMTDLDRYRHGTEHCARMADTAVSPEICELWRTMQRSYQFLLDREERTGRAVTRQDGVAT